jgi:arsenate reductase-like glutaredoxin family protein
MKNLGKMKTFRLVLASLAMFAFAAISAQAQVTPQAVIGNAPSLPEPKEWAENGGHTEAFRAKIAELNAKLGKIQAEMIPDISEADLQQAQQHQQHQQTEALRRQQQDMKAGMEQMEAMGITQADLVKMQNMSEKEIEAFMRQRMNASPEMQALASLGITEADLKKIEKMNEKQSEAYIKKRLAENGYTEADLKKRMEEAGVPMKSKKEWKEQERREQKAQADGEALIKAQETMQAYIDRSQVAGKKIAEAEKSASERIAALRESRKDAIEKAAAQCNQPEEVLRGTITAEQLESYCRRHRALVNDYRADAYQIWHEYVLAAQGHLKILLPYAQAADDAKAKTPGMTGNAATDQLQRMSNNAIAVAGQYLNITESEPELYN